MSTFKIHLAADNIRKFRLDIEHHDYSTFIDFLQKQYPKYLQDKQYTVQYYDEDGDLISVSSQIEFEEMVNGKTEVVLYIKLHEQESDSDYSREGFMEVLRRLREMRSGERRFHGVCPGGRWRNGGPRFARACSERFSPEARIKKSSWIFQKGLELMEKGDEESLLIAKNFFLKSYMLVPHPASIYNVACVESLLGNVEESVHALKNAIKAGYDNLEHMLNDSDLDNIRHTEGYDECVHFLTNEEDAEAPLTESVPEEVIVPEERPVEESKPVETEPETTPQETSVESNTVDFAPQENPVSQLANSLEQMGIILDEEQLQYYVERFGSDLTQIVNHYFRTLAF